MNVTFMCRLTQIHALKNAWYKTYTTHKNAA